MSRREHERDKYVALLRDKPDYGSTNHGKGIFEHLLSLRPASVVDVGCGHNDFARMCLHEGVHAIGVDFANTRADVISPAHQLPFHDGEFDWLTAFDLLEHLLTDEIDEVLTEFCRVAKTGLMFSICYRDSKITWKGETLHPTVKPEQWWIDVLSKYIHVKKFDGYLYGEKRADYGEEETDDFDPHVGSSGSI